MALIRLMPKPSRLVKIAIVIAASSDRAKESSSAESCVALIKSPPVLHRIAAPSTSKSGEYEELTFWSRDSWIWLISRPWRSTLYGKVLRTGESVYRPVCGAFRSTHALMTYRAGFIALQSFQILSKLTVPRRNHNRNGSSGLRLAGKANYRLGLSAVDVTELFDLFSFASAHIRQLLCATKHTDPTRATRSRSALDWNRAFDSTWINRAPISRLIFGGAPGQVLSFAQLVFRICVVLVPGYGPLLVDCSEKTK